MREESRRASKVNLLKTRGVYNVSEGKICVHQVKGLRGGRQSILETTGHELAWGREPGENKP